MKQYEYKVYDNGGTYIGTLNDVANEHPSFSYDINGGCGSMSLQIARNSEDFYSATDIIPGNRIKIKEKTGGVQVYSGYINRAYARIGRDGQSQVYIECVGNVTELNRRIVEDSDGDTALQANSADPSEIFSDLIGLSDGVIVTGTIQAVGTVASIVFNADTTLRAIDSVLERTPNGWYWFVDSEDKAHFKEVSATADHILTIGREIGDIEFSSKVDNIVNDVIITGGTPEGEEQIMKRYTDASSIENFGRRQRMISDGRLYDTNSLDYIAQSNLSTTYEREISFTIYDNEHDARGYNIESIKPGHTIKIKDPNGANSDTLWDEAYWDTDFWDSSVNSVFNEMLVVQRIDYQGDRIKITLSDDAPNVGKDLETVKRNLDAFQTAKIPVRPTV